MAIEKSGKWLKGTEAADIDEFLRRLTAEAYPADRFEHSVCACGSFTFKLEYEEEQGVARRHCASCGAEAFIGDSEEFWSEAEPVKLSCRCRNEQFEVAVGFSHHENGDVRWITVGHRCTKCGVLGACIDWHVRFSPTHHLYAMV